MRWLVRCLALLPLLAYAGEARAAAVGPVILDTDIGDDIDDAFALALVLRSPEIRLDAVSTSYGDTALRTRLVRRLLDRAGRGDVAIGTGPATADATRFTQAAWAAFGPGGSAPDAVTLLLDRLRQAPAGSITLVAIAPPTTIGAAIVRDPVAFRRVRQVVMMGGSVNRGYGRLPGTTSATPGDEYNIRADPRDMRRLLARGVGIVLMPLDATEIAVPPAMREAMLGRPDPVDRALGELYAQWAAHNPWGPVPVVFDVVPVAWLLDPSVCHPVPIRLAVRDDGATVQQPGATNVRACLDVDRPRVLNLLDSRLQAAPASR